MDLDPEMFLFNDHKKTSSFHYATDLSKYDQESLTQELRDVMYRPNKMAKLYERYWDIASFYDKVYRDKAEEISKKKYHPRKMAKTED